MKYTVTREDEAINIKHIMKERIGISSRLYTRLKKNDKIMVNGISRMPHEMALAGDVIEVLFDYEKNTFECEKRLIDVLYEDEELLIVNKDAYYVVHPTKGHPTGTLMNFAADHMRLNGDDSKIRFVNRLDRDTSGVVIMAKNQFVHHRMSEDMKEGSYEKRYLALVDGVLKDDLIRIEAPIEREADDSIMRVVREDGKPSTTIVSVLERFEEHTLVQIELLTGRTHQIRVHMKHIGYPIVGDVLYNGPSELIERQFLHCFEMSFNHPISRKRMAIHAANKRDMDDALRQLRGETDE
jgi:23S rRNA pseudouridine1911/1915/1917 synthase